MLMIMQADRRLETLFMSAWTISTSLEDQDLEPEEKMFWVRPWSVQSGVWRESSEIELP